MGPHNKRLNILSAEEKFALYELPDFNEAQQQQYLIFTNDEQQLIFARSNLSAQLYCALQIGYFKAKQMFFDLAKVPQEDIDFLMKCYFPSQQFFLNPITKYEYYQQVKQISNLFKYRLWSRKFMVELYDYVVKISKRDINIGFILAELLQFLSNQKIIRPGYTILQDIISNAVNSESKRLGNIIISSLDDKTRQALEQLLGMEDVISYLAVLKQDSKDFGYKIMTIERKKLETCRLSSKIDPHLR